MLDPRGVTGPRVAVRGIGRATDERVERMRVVNRTRQIVLAMDVRQAANPWSRMAGLIGRATLGPGEGLHITPCFAVHTLFLRFPIDVLFLDRNGSVVRTEATMRPFRCVWGSRRAHSALEFPAGTIMATATAVGDRVTFEESDTAAARSP
ncbi:MAG: DUF192 domain-containing protein [Dehalococcoidia bacterium]